jgi:hypothetical protein
MWRHFTLCVFTTVLLTVPAPPSPERNDCSHRTLTVHVKDLRGRPVPGLAAGDFEAQFRGKPVKILSATPDTRPHRVVILLDASASMAGTWERPLYLATHAVDTMPATAQVALFVFDTKIKLQLGFSAGRPAIREALLALHLDEKEVGKKVRGRTAVYDALLSAIRLLDSPTNSDVLYLITDAGDNSSDTKPKDVAKALTSNGAHLFLSLVYPGPFLMSRSDQYLGALDLTELVQRVGGEFVTPYVNFAYDPKNPDLFAASLRTFELSLIDDYLLELDLSEPVRKYENWTLKLSKEKRERWKDARLLYAKELAPCEP